MSSRLWKCVLAFACMVPGIPSHAQYPDKPVRFIVPYPPGQATDVVTRLAAEELTKLWGKQVVVDNRAGGAGIPGTVVGRDAPADGYTITLGTTSSLAVNTSLIPNIPYDPIKDFVMVNGLFKVPQIIVASAAVPYQSLADMVNAAKKQPGKLSWGYPGLGTTPHLSGELFKQRAAIDIVDIIYKGSGQMVADLIGNQIPLAVDSIVSAIPQIASGRAKALAVTTTERVPQLPNVPTVAEVGYPGFESVAWGGLLAPRGTPPAVVDKISGDLRKVLSDREMQKRIIDRGAIPDPRGSREWSEFVRAEMAKWGELVKKANIKLQ